MQAEDKARTPSSPNTAWRWISALIVPGLLALLFLLALALIARLLPSSLLPSSLSALTSPLIFSSWALSPSFPVLSLVPSPLDPTQVVHPDVAFLLHQAHNDTPLIPDIVHFVIGTTHTALSSSPPSVSSLPIFGVQHWLALKSASEIIRPTSLYCHVVAEPSSQWWLKALPYCTRVLPTRAITHIFGRPVYHRQHKSDILRLEALLQWGGVALDLDVLTTSSWKRDGAEYALMFKLDLLVGLTQSATKNWADRYDVSFIAARTSSPLLREWYGTYRMFDESSAVVRTGVVEGSEDLAFTIYDDHLLAFSHTLMWTLSVVRPHQLTSLQPLVIGFPYAMEAEGMKTLYGETGGVMPVSGWTVHLWQEEHEMRRVVTGKDGRVQQVEGVPSDEVQGMYDVENEQAVCQLSKKSMYGTLLLHSMNIRSVAYQCPR